jgi:hypothetical protein
MNVVAHQRIGMNPDAAEVCYLCEEFEIEPVIFRVDKNGSSVNAALCDVQGYAGNDEARTAGIARRPRTALQLRCLWLLGQPANVASACRKMPRFKRIIPPSPFVPFVPLLG